MPKPKMSVGSNESPNYLTAENVNPSIIRNKSQFMANQDLLIVKSSVVYNCSEDDQKSEKVTGS